jgi:hypothetical protein
MKVWRKVSKSAAGIPCSVNHLLFLHPEDLRHADATFKRMQN